MTTVSRQQSLEQQRAACAWTCVQNVKSDAKEYRTLARGAPAEIQANGLGQSLSFWRARGYRGGQRQANTAHAQLYGHVSDWVGSQVGAGAGRDLLEWVVQDADANQYRRATAEAMAFLAWLKRFAEAELAE